MGKSLPCKNHDVRSRLFLASLGLVVASLLAFGYLAVLIRAKTHLVSNVVGRGGGPLGDPKSDDLIYEITRGLCASPGPATSHLPRSERAHTTELEFPAFVLRVETPDKIEEEQGGKKLSYPDFTVWVTPDPALADLEAMPSSWGEGPYDKLLTILTTTSDEAAETINLIKIKDVETLLVEKAKRTPIMKRGSQKEVLGDGFVFGASPHV